MLGNEHFWAQVTSFRTSEPHVSVCQWGIAVSSESESLILTALLSRQRSTLWKSTQLSQHRILSPAESTLYHPFMSLSLVSRVSTYLAGIADALLAALSARCFFHCPVFCHLRLTYDLPLPPNHPCPMDKYQPTFSTSLHSYPQRPNFCSVLFLSVARPAYFTLLTDRNCI